PGTPSTSRNTSRRQCLPGGTAPRCSPCRAVLPAQCGSSLRPNTASASPGECRGQASRAYQRRKRISVSSSLLGGYDEPEILRSSSYQICLTGAEAGQPELIAFKRTFTDPVPQKQESRYAAQGIDAFHGLARFVGPDTVSVAGQELKAHHILIATGARSVPLRFPGTECVITSDRFLELESLPHRIALIGDGYIAAEFSHIAARVGAHVTVFQRA